MDRMAMDAGTPGSQLMAAAGKACADEVERRWNKGRIHVLAGPGANGGDGFVAARLLAEAGRNVRVGHLGDRVVMTGDAGAAAAQWAGEIIALNSVNDIAAFMGQVIKGDVVIDAIFGAGLSRPLVEAHATVAQLLTETGAHVLSVDVPSGVFGNKANVPDNHVVADVTVTFTALKPAHVLEPAASACGEVVVADIGVPSSVLSQVGRVGQLNAPGLWSRKLPWPGRASHKHSRGRLAVVAGGAGSTGAARLAARSGLRSGAGAVTLYGRAEAMPELTADSVAVMTRLHDGAASFLERSANATAFVIGPAAGLTVETRQHTMNIVRTGKPCVLDADALTIFRDDPRSLNEALHANCVLTPHAAEFERIFPDLLNNAPDKLAAVRAAADRSGAVIVLKGADTIIAAPDGEVFVNVHSSPFLATAGSGDVLAGIIGGWLAQGLAPVDAACAGAWIHGDASLRLGPGLIAEDLVEILPRSLGLLFDAVRQTR